MQWRHAELRPLILPFGVVGATRLIVASLLPSRREIPIDYDMVWRLRRRALKARVLYAPSACQPIWLGRP